MGIRRFKKPGGVSMPHILFYLILVVVVIALLIVFIVLRDDIDSRTLDRFLSALRLGGGKEESGEIRFDPGMQNLYTLSGDNLCVLSPARLVIYGTDGRELISRSVGFENPALYAAGEKVIAFDRQNPGGFVAKGSEILLSMDFRTLTAAANQKGQYVLVTEESGWRSVARFYNDKDKATYQYNSSTYLLAAALSPSGGRMAVAGPVQEGVSIASKIVFLETGNTEPLGQVDLPGELVLSMTFSDNSHVCIITETRVYFFSDTGKPLGDYSWDGESFLAAYPTDKALFLHVGRWANKRYGRLVCLGYEGDVWGETPLTEAPDAIAAAGKVCAVLTDGWMTEYYLDNNTLVQRAHWETEALSMLPKNENAMLMLYRDTAVWNQETKK